MNNKQYELMISIMQLEELMAKSELIDYNSEQLTIQYNGDIYEIYFDHNRLVKTPGYQILISNISNIEFGDEEGETILMYVTQDEKEYEFGIYKKEWWRN